MDCSVLARWVPSGPPGQKRGTAPLYRLQGSFWHTLTLSGRPAPAIGNPPPVGECDPTFAVISKVAFMSSVASCASCEMSVTAATGSVAGNGAWCFGGAPGGEVCTAMT